MRIRGIVAWSFLSRSEHDPVVLREEERRQVVDAAAVARLPAQHRARRRVPHLGTCMHTFSFYSSRQTREHHVLQLVTVTDQEHLGRVQSIDEMYRKSSKYHLRTCSGRRSCPISARAPRRPSPCRRRRRAAARANETRRGRRRR
jgi:hypothetical protein